MGLKLSLTLVLVLLLVPLVVASDFSPASNINMRGRYNVTNASYLCLGDDCRAAWPSGSGGGGSGGIITITGLDTFITVRNGTTANVSANLSAFNTAYNDTAFCSALVSSVGNWSAVSSSYYTSAQSNVRYLQNITCSPGTVLQNGTTSGAQCVAMTVDTNSGGVSNVTSLITGNNYLVVNSNATTFNVTANVSVFNAAFNDTVAIGLKLDITDQRYNETARINSLNSSLMSNDSAQLSLINARAATGTCSAGTVVQNTTTTGVQCVSVSGGAGDLTDVLQGTGVIVTNSAGPQPSVALNTTYVDANYVGQSEYANLDTDSTNDLTTSTVFTNASTSRFNITGVYNALVLVVGANSLTGTDIDESTLVLTTPYQSSAVGWVNTTTTTQTSLSVNITGNTLHLGNANNSLLQSWYDGNGKRVGYLYWNGTAAISNWTG
jgi:hypothetical protein